MKLYKIVFGFLFFFGIYTFGQDSLSVRTFDKIPENQLQTDKFGTKFFYDKKAKARYYRINGETVVIMDELRLIKKPKFNNELDEKYYRFINRKLSRVYPLFLIALQQYQDIHKDIGKMEKSSQKRKYIRKKQNELADQYEKKLRNLTTTEGRVFTKLMNRATGKTVYEIIRELRGGWSAFWWNVKGNMADVDIKTPYNPHKNRSDYYLENLLQSHWNAKHLPPYPGYQNYRVKKN